MNTKSFALAAAMAALPVLALGAMTAPAAFARGNGGGGGGGSSGGDGMGGGSGPNITRGAVPNSTYDRRIARDIGHGCPTPMSDRGRRAGINACGPL